jgi:hypothetical protein
MVVAVVIVLGGLLSACGGGGSGKPLTLDEYFQELKALSTDLHTGEAPILSTLSNSQNVQELKDALAQYPVVADAYLKGLTKLDPPEQAKQAHADAVTAGKDFLDAVQKAIKDTQNVTNVDDFFATADAVQITISSQSMTVACSALQQVAVDSKITADLGCPAGTTN